MMGAPGGGRGAQGVGSQCFMGTESQFGEMESSGDRWRGRLHDSVSVPDAAELCASRW